MKIKELLEVLLGLPKSIYLNLRVFGISKGLSLPILISSKTKLNSIYKGCIEINENCSFGTIKIGINYGPFERGKGRQTYININSGKIIFKGKANIASDSVLNVTSGICIFGENFIANNGFICSCENSIEFGNDVLFGWACSVMDGDGHRIIQGKSNEIINESKPIIIEDHVWIAANSTILKGALIKKNCVIAFNSIINKKYFEENVILGGKPAHIVKREIQWIR